MKIADPCVRMCARVSEKVMHMACFICALICTAPTDARSQIPSFRPQCPRPPKNVSVSRAFMHTHKGGNSAACGRAQDAKFIQCVTAERHALHAYGYYYRNDVCACVLVYAAREYFIAFLWHSASPSVITIKRENSFAVCSYLPTRRNTSASCRWCAIASRSAARRVSSVTSHPSAMLLLFR